MNAGMNNVVDYINVHRDRYVDELKQYLAIPSISALPDHSADRGPWSPSAPAAEVLQRHFTGHTCQPGHHEALE